MMGFYMRTRQRLTATMEFNMRTRREGTEPTRSDPNVRISDPNVIGSDFRSEGLDFRSERSDRIGFPIRRFGFQIRTFGSDRISDPIRSELTPPVPPTERFSMEIKTPAVHSDGVSYEAMTTADRHEGV